MMSLAIPVIGLATSLPLWGNIFNVRAPHVFVNSQSVAVSLSGTPVCSDRPATMMTASPPTRRRGLRANPDTPSKGAASRLHESASAPSKPHSASHPAGAQQPVAPPLLPGPSKFHVAAPFGLDVVP